MNSLFNKMPYECILYTLNHFSTESERASFASASTECHEAIQSIRKHEEFLELMTFPKTSFIGKIAPLLPQGDSLVDRVKRAAVASIKKDRGLLFPKDWAQLHVDPKIKTHDLTLKQLDLAGEIAEQRKALVAAFEDFFEDEPGTKNCLGIHPDMSLEQKAFQICNKLDTMKQESIETLLFGSIYHEKVVLVKFILGTIRHFDSEFLGEMLEKAIDSGNLDSIKAILNDSREIAPHTLSSCYAQATRLENLDLTELFLQSKRVG